MQKQLTLDPRVEMPPIKRSMLVIIDDSITDDYILGVVAALQGIEKSAYVKHEALTKPRRIIQELTFTLHLRFPQSIIDRGIDFILSRVLGNYTLNCEIKEQLDFEQVLTLENIKQIAGPSGRCFAQAVGILTGAEAGATIDLKPVVQGMQKQFENVLSCYDIPSRILEELIPFVNNHSLVVDLQSRSLGEYGFKVMLQEVLDSQLVVGPPSFYTYAAACLEIPCIEFCRTREELQLMSKWSSLRYSAVLEEEIEHFNADRLEAAWKHWFGINQRDENIVLDSDG